MRPIDRYANAVWRYLFIDNSFLEHSQIDLKAVLFSIMARGMYISLPEVPNNLLHAFGVMKIDMGIGTYQDTISMLEKVGFMYCDSSVCGTNTTPRLRRWRVEFPFVCSLKLGEKVIKVVCAQVPPFFCLMPANLHHKVILEPYLTDIMHSVNEALEEKLMEYYAEVCVNYAKDVAAGK